jgi:hypothetical protein
MKYLSTYTLFERVSKETKLFESESFQNQWKRIEPILRDILLPLNDIDIDYIMYMVGGKNSHDDGVIKIIIDGGDEEFTNDGLSVYQKFFTWKQIKEEILHVISFMDSEDIDFSKLEIKQFINNAFHTIEIYDESEVERLEDDLKFTEIDITFCKIP